MDGPLDRGHIGELEVLSETAFDLGSRGFLRIA
jgi:hypothetical protein